MQENKGYVVFEDIVKATAPKVHSVDCFFYKRWLKKGSKTTKWHGPYSKNEAIIVAQTLGKKTKFQPSNHQCMKLVRSY